MITSSRSVNHGFLHRGPLVDVGDVGRYRKDCTFAMSAKLHLGQSPLSCLSLTKNAMTQVSKPSIRKSQNQPGLPPTPRISSIPAANSAEMIRATSEHRQQ